MPCWPRWPSCAGRGMSDRPALVLVAGWGLPAAVWQPLLPALESGFRVHLLDLLGQNATAAAAADDLVRRVGEPAHWLGWSLGGSVALLAALRHPGQVTRLRLLAANPCFVARPDYPFAMPAPEFHHFRQSFRRDPESAWRRFLTLQCRGGSHVRDDMRRLLSLAGGTLPAPAAMLDRQLDWLEQLDLRAALKELTCPVTALYGAADALVPAAAAHGWPEGAAGQLDATGHVPFLDMPAAVLEAFDRLEARHDPVR